MIPSLSNYTHWLHGRWPAGTVEKLPEVDAGFETNVPGLYVVGDLTGIPLLKFSADSGTRAIRRIADDPEVQRARAADADGLDVAIIGAGVSGMAAALAAREAGLRFEVLEATEPFSTIVNFPKGKPIYTYPRELVPAGSLQFTAEVKEPLVDELRAQTLERGIEPCPGRVERVVRRDDGFDVIVPDGQDLRALRVVVAIGRSGNFRRLGVDGEDLDKVSNRLHDPQDHAGQDVLVVGGGDSAMETAIALTGAGARVTLSYRKAEFSRPKPENIEQLERLRDGGSDGASLRLMLASRVRTIEADAVILEDADGEQQRLPNDAVFTMIGREPPLDFFRRAGVRIRGEMTAGAWTGLGLFVAFCAWLYHWKSGGALTSWWRDQGWFPFQVPELLAGASAQATSVWSLFGYNLGKPGFWYSLAYCALVVVFGIRRVRRRQTQYIAWQTASLALFQLLPLFLLPYIVLPWLGNNGWFDAGVGKSFADAFFPEVSYDHGREYWRAFGFVLAWPLFVWNVFTHEPLTAWLVVSLVQTFVIIPAIVYFWGKGAYCGWICSCGALAETLGDSHRHKMVHGPGWNRFNMIGQAILAVCLLLLLTRVVAWIAPGTAVGDTLRQLHEGLLYGWSVGGVPLNYSYLVDLMLAGVIGYGLYFWYSGRVWCRFACPLAALMHIYARFSRFRILADKKKCISCNVCTSVCHQGIDVMNFANKGLPMADPECVRCSACVESCPTGVLEFGQVGADGRVIGTDSLTASPVRAREVGSAVGDTGA